MPKSHKISFFRPISIKNTAAPVISINKALLEKVRKTASIVNTAMILRMSIDCLLERVTETNVILYAKTLFLEYKCAYSNPKINNKNKTRNAPVKLGSRKTEKSLYI